jgi:hypothetical protein
MAAVLALSAPAFAGGTESPDKQALASAIAAYGRAMREGRVARPGLLTLIDYTRPSTERRLWVVDVLTGRVQLHELVAHGRNSGEVLPTAFSNADGTHEQPRLFVTRDSYVGSNRYSLRLDGLDPGLNDHALARAIVIHGAPYVSEGLPPCRDAWDAAGDARLSAHRSPVRSSISSRAVQLSSSTASLTRQADRQINLRRRVGLAAVSAATVVMFVCLAVVRSRAARPESGRPQVASTVQLALSTATLPSIKWGNISDVATQLA